MGSSTRRMALVWSFEEGKEQLGHQQYEDAMRSFVHAHQLALELHDNTGAYISCDHLLSSIISCIGTGEEEENRCCGMLVGFLRVSFDEGSNNIQEEAWAAYYVGRSLFLRDGGEDMDYRAVHWLQNCYWLASTNYLKYEVSMCLGEMLISQGSISRAVDHFKSAIQAAKLLDRSFVTIEVFARYMLLALLCQLRETQEAHCQLSDLKSLADLSDDPFIKGVSARGEGYLCYRLHRYHDSKKANEVAISLLENLPADWDKHLTTYSLLDGDPTGSFPWIIMRITAESLESAWCEIGKIELLVGDLACAERAFHRALQCGTIDNKLDALIELSTLCFWQGHLQEADAYVDKVLETSGESWQSAHALVVRARITYKRHKDDLSEEVFSKALGFLDKAEKMITVKWPGDLPLIQHWQGFLFALMLRREQAIQKFKQSLDGFWEAEAKLGPSNREGRIEYLEIQKTIFRYLQLCLATSEPEQVKYAIIWAEKERARDLIREMNGDTLDVDAGPVSFDSKDEDMAWEEIESIVRLAGEDSVFLLFTKVQDNMVIMYLLHAADEPKCNVSISRVKDEPNEFLLLPIFTRVERVKNQICSTTNSCKAQQEWLQYFHMLLIEPWKADLERIRPSKIILVPTEELSLLPFAALRDGSREDDENPYLIQQYALVYAPSLQVFKQCQSRWESLKSRQPSQEQMALVVGNPTLTDQPELVSLTSAQKEAVDVARMLQDDAGFCDVKLLQENDATVEAVLDFMTRCNWVHMACHAIVDPEFPNGALLLGSQSSASGTMQPGLASVGNPRLRNLLAESRTLDSVMMTASESATLFRGIANRNFHHVNLIPDAVNIDQPEVERALLKFAQQTERHYAGKLTGDDIGKNLQASGVVLSACSTGLGHMCGEGILGLSRSLHVAGVPATLVSLWKVRDKATLDFMQLLYSELSQGMELAIAVQSTMKSMIEAEDDFGNPEYAVENWAAFIVSGSPFVKLVY